jgi:hypothetical protein
MGTLRYSGDVRTSLPTVIGGRFLVQDATYDDATDQTTVQVAPLRDPLAVAGLRD